MVSWKTIIRHLLTSHSLMGKTLWSGTWSSGTITVPDTAKYLVYLCTINGNPVLCVNEGSRIRGHGITGSSTVGNQYSQTFQANISGNTWMWAYANQLTHIANGNHTATTMTVSKVVGLIPQRGA